MNAGNRAARALKLVVTRFGKNNRRTMKAFFDAGGEDSNHALMPIIAIKRDREVLVLDRKLTLVNQRHGLGLHRAFNIAPLLVVVVKLRSEGPSSHCGLGE